MVAAAGIYNNLSRMEKIRDILGGTGTKSLKSSWATTQKLAAVQLEIALAKVRWVLTKIGTALIPVVVPILVKIATAALHVVNTFAKAPKWLRYTVLGFIALLAIGGPLLIFFGAVVGAIGAISTAFAAEAVFEGIAFWPVVAVAAVIAILVACYVRFKWFRTAVHQLFLGLKLEFQLYWDAAKWAFNLVVNIVAWSIKAIINIFKWLITAWNNSEKWLENALNNLIRFFKWVGHEVSVTFHNIFAAIVNPFIEAINLAIKLYNLIPFHKKVAEVHMVVAQRWSTQGMARGGAVQGMAWGGFASSGTDTIPAMLSPGEYVIQASAASALGTGTLNALNNGETGALGGGLEIAAAPVTLYLDGREVARSYVNFTLSRKALL